MKHQFFLCTVFAILFFSCQKDKEEGNDNYYFQKIQQGLLNHLSENEFAQLDFSKIVETRTKSDVHYLRIGIKNENFKEHFVLLEVTDAGGISRGRNIVLKGAIDENQFFNGTVSFRDLEGQELLHSTITKGFVDAWHSRRPAAREDLLVDPFLMPEVIVYAYPSEGNGCASFISLESLFGAGGGVSYSYGNYGNSVGGYYAGYDYYGGGTYREEPDHYAALQKPAGEGGMISEEETLVDFDVQGDLDPIDLKSYLRCFETIPDDGATCSIEIYADLPVDSDPNKLLDWANGSPGHTFLSIRKTKGSLTISQNIGFYPRSGWKTALTNAPIAGKFVDNEKHEFNASFKMNLNPAEFRNVIAEISSLSQSARYDIDEYNCTDFALDIFNTARVDKLKIPLYQIPGGMAAGGTSTPQGLFNKLNQMKASGDPEAVNITTGIYKGWVGSSHGPCN